MRTSLLLPIHLTASNGGPALIVGLDLLLVGRDGRCDVRIASPRISRFHCSLSRHRDEVIVRDLGSTNGTLINGRRTTTGRLRPGDELGIADFRYHLEAGGDRSRRKPADVPG